jgi:hypothetical protein
MIRMLLAFVALIAMSLPAEAGKCHKAAKAAKRAAKQACKGQMQMAPCSGYETLTYSYTGPVGQAPMPSGQQMPMGYPAQPSKQVPPS